MEYSIAASQNMHLICGDDDGPPFMLIRVASGHASFHLSGSEIANQGVVQDEMTQSLFMVGGGLRPWNKCNERHQPRIRMLRSSNSLATLLGRSRMSPPKQ